MTYHERPVNRRASGDVIDFTPEQQRRLRTQLQAEDEQRQKDERNRAATCDFIGNLATSTLRHWPRHLGHPYDFKWVSQEYRELVLHWLTKPVGGRTDYPAKDVLRWLLYRWRCAAYRTKPPLPNMKRHRWVWFGLEEMARNTGLEERHLQKVLTRLEERRLLVRVYESGAMHHTHYRPHADLFRACVLLTFMTNDTIMTDYWWGENTNGTISEDDQAYLRDAVHHCATELHDEMHRAVSQFVASDDPNRAVALETGVAGMFNRAMDALDT